MTVGAQFKPLAAMIGTTYMIGNAGDVTESINWMFAAESSGSSEQVSHADTSEYLVASYPHPRKTSHFRVSLYSMRFA